MSNIPTILLALIVLVNLVFLLIEIYGRYCIELLFLVIKAYYLNFIVFRMAFQ